jgi:hypothetical protein
LKSLKPLGPPRKQAIFMIVLSGFGVLSLHVLVDIVGIASLVNAPRAILWMSMFAWSMVYNVVTCGMLLYEALRTDLKDVPGESE